jgi:lipoic acid synthetase
MILGDVCTRRCPFCDVAHGRPLPPDANEPRPARARRSATCDSALRRGHERRPRRPARRRGRGTSPPASARSVASAPDTHDRGARPRLPRPPGAGARRSWQSRSARRDEPQPGDGAAPLQARRGPAPTTRTRSKLLRGVQGCGIRRCATKSGLMLGLGETDEEIVAAMRDHPRARRRPADARPVPAASSTQPLSKKKIKFLTY